MLRGCCTFPASVTCLQRMPGLSDTPGYQCSRVKGPGEVQGVLQQAEEEPHVSKHSCYSLERCLYHLYFFPRKSRNLWFWFLDEKSGLFPFFWYHGHSGTFPQRPFLPVCGTGVSPVLQSWPDCMRDLLLAGALAFWRGWNVAEAFRPLLTMEQRLYVSPGCPLEPLLP